MLSRFFFMTLCICLAVMPVAAQETPAPTPQPEQHFIQSWQAENIFPAAVRFSIVLGFPFDGLTSAELLIQYGDNTQITESLDLKESAVVKEPYSELAYVWAIPADIPPQLFHDITFKWRIVAVDNETALISDVVQFRDQRAEWSLDQPIGNGIRVTLATGDPLGQIQNTIQPVYDLLAVNTGEKPTFRVLLDHLPDCDYNAQNETTAIGPVSKTEVECYREMAQSLFQASEYDVVKSPSALLEDIQNAFAEYLTGKFYETRWVDKAVPPWFQTGLALFYSPAPKTALGPLMATAARTNTLYSLVEMSTAPTYKTNVAAWRAQSYGMVVYIASQIGVDGLFKLANTIASSESFSAAYRSLVGQPIEALLPNMGTWALTRAGLAAFSFTPYQAATATPTATATTTLTFTPSATATDTITPTPTVTGVLSRTPSPTLIPTRTPTNPPPTRTPRPPGSLNTATPTPEPPSSIVQAVENPRVSIFILAMGLLVIAISAVIYRMIRGR